MSLSLKTSSDNGQTNEPEAQATVSYSVTGESVLIPNNGATRNTFTSSSSREARDNSQSLLSCEHLTDILWIDCDNSSDLDAVKGKTNNERLAEIVGPPERESVRIEFSETELRPTCNKPIKETVNDSTQRNADGGKSKLNNHTVRPSFVNKDDNSFGSQPIGVVPHQTLTSEETEMNRDEISPERLSDYCTIDKIDKSLQNVAVELSDSRKPLCEKLTDTNPTFEKHDVTYLKNSTENSHKLDILVPDEGHCKIPDNCQKSKSEESFRDELRFPKEQVTLGQVRVEDGVQKSIQDGSHQTNIGIHNTETSGALRNCEATKGRIKRRELLRSSGGNILRPARRPSDVAALTESTFSAIYQPFNSVKTQLVRQARDILLCQFLGDFKKFHEGFLLPAGTLLQIIQYKSTITDSCPCEQNLEGWPFCFQKRVVIQLGEIDKAFLRVGDHYFCLRGGKTSELEGERDCSLLLTCVYRDYAGVKERVINEKYFDKLFTMDWLQDVSGTSTSSIGLLSNPESDEYLPTLLQHLLVTVERGIERIECETVRKPWTCNHVRSEPSTRCHNASVDTKEISVQTSLLNSSVVVTDQNSNTVQGDGMDTECQPVLSSDANGNHSNNFQCVDSQGNCSNNYDRCFIELPGSLGNQNNYLDLPQNDKVSGCSSDISEYADNQNKLSDLSETVVKEKCCLDSTQTVDNQDTPSDILQNIQDERELLDLFETVVFTEVDKESSSVVFTEVDKESSSAIKSSSVSDDSPVVTSLPSPNKEPTERHPANAFKEEDPDDGYHDNTLSKPHCISQVDPDLLHSEIACLPGSRDIGGRSVVVIFLSVFREFPNIVPSELARLLIYFHSVPRKEVTTLGFCVLIDGRKSEASDWTILDETFCLVEANIPNAINTVVVYTNCEVISGGDSLLPSSGFKYNVAVDVEHLHRYVQRDQLFPQYSGNYKYDHQEWISFRMFLEPFISGCQLSGRHLVTVMQDLRGSRLPPTASLTSQIIEQQKRVINQAFQDEQLRHLVEEGDTVLNELESYGSKTPYNHDYKDSLAKGSALHGELKKATAKLAKLADRRLKKLEQCLQLKTFQEEAHQVLDWLCHAGQDALDKHQSVADTLPGIKEQEGEFEKFYFLAMRQLEKGNDLLEDAAAFNPKVSNLTAGPPNVVDDGGHGDVQELADTLKDHMNTFTEHLEDTRERLEDTAKCYHFLDRSYEWALETMKFVSKMKVEQLFTSGLMKMLKQLQDYLEDHPPIADEVFQEMLNLATKLENKKLLDQCKAASARCQETMELLQTRRATLLKAKQHQEIEALQHQQELWEPDSDSSSQTNFQHHHSWTPQSTSTPTASSISSSGFYRRRSIATSSPHSCSIGSYTSFPSNYNPVSGLKDCHSNHSIDDKEDHILSQGLITEDLTTQGPVASISLSKLEARSNHTQKEAQPYGVFKSHSGSSLVGLKERIIGSIVAGAASIQNSAKEGSSHHRPLKKLMRKCQTWQLCEEALQKATSEVREQNEKLQIDQVTRAINQSGENVSNVVETEDPSSSSRYAVAHTLSDPGTCSSPVPVNSHLARTANSNQPEDLDQQMKRKKTLLHIMREMIQTEKDYVKSLEYIIENYLPELLREDIPQALRGQRNVIFGNIEKIFEFHNHHFLSQLEECENLPFLVGQCFLAYEPQFYLYALYNKNKPKSEALMVEYGNAFFKKKQLELGDKMNLASYLLKPVQRMGKYALLLKQLLKECPERELEHEDLKAAEEMVRFQLRHGNDLLAMDALRECDVNLKEQGKLLRQDEFLVWQGRSRKSLRHIFLFEDLVLFSKSRRDPERKGQEIYQYKLSFKMTDIGMTEQVGDSPTKFEIWFRKRKQNDTYVLQAPSPEVKQAWVVEISKLLWKQALRNREMRLAEMSCMGIGSKPCLDIKPNEDQISDRAINFQQLGRAFRFRNSIAVSSFDQLRNNKRPHSTISVSSSSSSGSSHTSYLQHGSLNLGFEPGDDPFRQCRRSITQQSQCSTESGISTDLSMASDSCGESERPRYKKAERSDSLLSNDSVITHLPISECPVVEEQLLEETETTSM